MTHPMMSSGGMNMPLNPNMGMVEQMRASRMPGQVGPLRAQIRGMRPASGMAAQQQPIMHGSGGGGQMYNQGTIATISGPLICLRRRLEELRDLASWVAQAARASSPNLSRPHLRHKEQYKNMKA